MKRGEFNVLVIDDDGAVALLVQALLRDVPRPRFRVEYAPAIRGALKRLREERFDVILVDISWAWNADPAALKKIRIFAPETAVVLLTDRNAATSWLNDSDCAGGDLLVKGEFDAELLKSTLARAVARRRVQELPHVYS